MNETDSSLKRAIQEYYVQAEPAYRNWGKDVDRPEIYALHCGFHPEGQPIDQYESVKLMTKRILSMAEILPGHRVLDAGCGSGALLFEGAESHKESTFYGVNISANQLETARSYILQKGLQNALVSMQDYLFLEFADGFFDRVIFSESAAHAQNKKDLFMEARRVLNTGGKVTIADAFLNSTPEPDSEMDKLVNAAASGWLLPNIPTTVSIAHDLSTSGFTHIKIVDITENILPSTQAMAIHAAKRLEEQGAGDDQLSKSRLACVAADKLMRNQTLGYFWITAIAN